MKNWILIAALAMMLLSPAYAGPVTDSPPQALPSLGSAAAEVEEVFVYLAVRSNRTPGASDPA